jgi:hypothetical protein
MSTKTPAALAGTAAMQFLPAPKRGVANEPWSHEQEIARLKEYGGNLPIAGEQMEHASEMCLKK